MNVPPIMYSSVQEIVLGAHDRGGATTDRHATKVISNIQNHAP